MVAINEDLTIPDEELSFTTSRSSGPGGQNVNKVETRVTLLFDVAQSPSLTSDQRDRILSRLATRINRQGILRVVAQKHRTQGANRKAAVERFAALLATALEHERGRRQTAVPPAAKQRRLERKRQRSRLKRARQPPDWDA